MYVNPRSGTITSLICGKWMTMLDGTFRIVIIWGIILFEKSIHTTPTGGAAPSALAFSSSWDGLSYYCPALPVSNYQAPFLKSFLSWTLSELRIILGFFSGFCNRFFNPSGRTVREQPIRALDRSKVTYVWICSYSQFTIITQHPK